MSPARRARNTTCTPPPEPRKIEVPVVPDQVTDALAEIAARAEALAETVDGADGTQSGDPPADG